MENEYHMVTHDQAMALLQRHDHDTGCNASASIPETGEPDPESTFYAKVGIKLEYRHRDVLWWLGY